MRWVEIKQLIKKNVHVLNLNPNEKNIRELNSLDTAF